MKKDMLYNLQNESDNDEKNMYDGLKDKLKKRTVYKIEGDASVYFVANEVLYGYDTIKLEDFELNIIWNEIRDFSIDDEKNIRFHGEITNYYLLEYNDVVELYRLL